jgi:hypothetical protein
MMFTMPLRLTALFLMLALAAASSATARDLEARDGTTSQLRYEIIINDEKPDELLLVGGKAGKVERRTLVGRYISTSTRLPAATWRDMVEHGKAPVHDFARCQGKTCEYGTYGTLESSRVVAVAAVSQMENGAVRTLVDFSETKATLGQDLCVGRKQCVGAPSFEEFGWRHALDVKPGETVTFGRPGLQVRVKLIEASHKWEK